MVRAHESDEELLGHLPWHQPQVPRETTERIVAAVTAAPGTDVLPRHAARIAFRFKPRTQGGPRRRRRHWPVHGSPTGRPAARTGSRSQRPLARNTTRRSPRAIVGFARQHEITQFVSGSIHRGWWHIAVGGPIVRRVIKSAGTSSIYVLIIPATSCLPRRPSTRLPPTSTDLAPVTSPTAPDAARYAGDGRLVVCQIVDATE